MGFIVCYMYGIQSQLGWAKSIGHYNLTF